MDYKSLYIKYPNHPGYNSSKIIEDTVTGVLVNKIEMILFTNKGEVYGNPEFGADLYTYLHQSNVSADFIKSEIDKQIKKYVPELTNTTYKLDVNILAGTLQDVMLIDVTLDGVRINAIFS